MDIAPPPGPGSRIQELGSRLSVRFRPHRSWGQIVFLVLWLAFWSFGGIAALVALPDAGPGELAFMLLWLCGWVGGECAVITVIAWQLVGKELLILTDGHLEVRKELGRFARTKFYDVAFVRDIEAVRVPSGEDERPRRDFCLRLSYEGTSIRIGEGMGEREAEYVASIVLSKIRPLPRWGDVSAADPWDDGDRSRATAGGS